jgi:biotin-(acetyl-CoA carboxylase) ligase
MPPGRQIGRQIRVHNSGAPPLDLPPPFRPVRLREVGDAFSHACRHAAALGGGTLVYVGRFDVAEFAVVLEPDEALASPWLAVYAGMVALADALAALAPPGKPITITWPDAIRTDEGLVGGGRLALPDGVEDELLPWLVFGATVRMVSLPDGGAGLRPLTSALDDEGPGWDIVADRLVESFARHLMRTIDHWRDTAFAAIANKYTSRLERQEDVSYAIDENGDLLMTQSGKVIKRRPLRPELAAPSWLDPQGIGPRI